MNKIKSCVKGFYLPTEKINDVVFSKEILGMTVGIIPKEGAIYAPFNAKVSALFPTNHAIGLKSESGVELLIHIGINTVELNGKYFEAMIKQDDFVKKGDLLINFDLTSISDLNYDPTVMMIVTNSNHLNLEKIRYEKGNEVNDVFEIKE